MEFKIKLSTLMNNYMIKVRRKIFGEYKLFNFWLELKL